MNWNQTRLPKKGISPVGTRKFLTPLIQTQTPNLAPNPTQPNPTQKNRKPLTEPNRAFSWCGVREIEKLLATGDTMGVEDEPSALISGVRTATSSTAMTQAVVLSALELSCLLNWLRRSSLSLPTLCHSQYSWGRPWHCQGCKESIKRWRSLGLKVSKVLSSFYPNPTYYQQRRQRPNGCCFSLGLGTYAPPNSARNCRCHSQ